MHLSSIFSFKSFSARLRIGSWFIILLVLLSLLEFTLRIPSVQSRLPDPNTTLWHAELIQAKLDYLKAYQDQEDINLLFIGNSAVQAGVNPEIFDAYTEQNDIKSPTSFNAAIEGLPPYGMQLFLEIYMRYVNPDLIIYGITPQDLNSNSPWAKDVTERVKAAPMSIAESRRGLRGKLTAFMLENSALYRYRFVLHQQFLRGGYMPENLYIYFDERGYHLIDHRLSDVPPKNRAVYINRAGVLNYSTNGEQLDSLIGIIEYCADNNIDLILVNFPLADGYYANFDTMDDYKLYLQTIQQIADEYQIPLWDMENLPPNMILGDHHFSDFNHLNQDGANQLTTYLADYYLQWLNLGLNIDANTASK